MPQFNVNVPHDLEKDEARQRMERMLEKVAEHYGDQVSDLQQTWNGDQLDFSFATYGIKVSGAGTVDDSQVTINGKIPIAAMMFKGKIESGLRDQIAKVLS